jgi:hypothetical protein
MNFFFKNLIFTSFSFNASYFILNSFSSLKLNHICDFVVFLFKWKLHFISISCTHKYSFLQNHVVILFFIFLKLNWLSHFFSHIFIFFHNKKNYWWHQIIPRMVSNQKNTLLSSHLSSKFARINSQINIKWLQNPNNLWKNILKMMKKKTICYFNFSQCFSSSQGERLANADHNHCLKRIYHPHTIVKI